MKGDWFKLVALLLAVAVSATSCSSSSTVAEGGIGGTGISMGTVSAIGSVWVNGVEYDTTGATVVKDGIESVDNNGTAGGTSLLPGMVVTVKGSINTNGLSGTASSVDYADNLEGPITDRPNLNTIVVLGQNVIIDNLTKDENGVLLNDASAFTVGEQVEVSGFVDGNGIIHATYIEKKSSTTLELKGEVTSIVGPNNFTIGALSVNTANILFDTSGLNVGNLVAVVGTGFIGGELIASSVEVGSLSLDTMDFDEAEMEGIVTSVVTPGTEFVLGTQRVQLDSGAEFTGGLAADIVPGVKLEVEGSFTAGVLIAKEISFKDGIELEGDVTAVGSGTVTLVGLSEFTIMVDDVLTSFEGDDSQFADIQVGHHLKIRGRDKGGNTVLATRIVSSVSAGTDVVLQGPLQVLSSPTVQVLGVSVNTTGMIFKIESSTQPMDSVTFFGTVALNDLVDLRGKWDGTNLTWESIALDN